MEPIYIVYGSVNGRAKSVAYNLQSQIEDEGITARIIDHGKLELIPSTPAICLIVVATTGAGDLPKNIQPLYDHLTLCNQSYSNLRYAVLGLGDTCFGDTFCMAGKRMDQLFSTLNASQIHPLTTIDASEVSDPMEIASPWLDNIFQLSFPTLHEAALK